MMYQELTIGDVKKTPYKSSRERIYDAVMKNIGSAETGGHVYGSRAAERNAIMNIEFRLFELIEMESNKEWQRTATPEDTFKLKAEVASLSHKYQHFLLKK